ncbi:hypothetical protein ACJRO7_000368 [Eucalyptus globulus]|uniref:NAC domain-containing protein n=1 Tax=Eucalyptus globulus TaxID=34317 RepID=A0ABD3LMC6_EUCGL
MESIETSLVDLPMGFRFRPTDDKLMVMNGSSSAVCKISTLKVNGRRTNDYGSWKPTGKPHKIRTQDRKNTLGLKKILVFKKCQSPKKAHIPNWYCMNTSDFVLYRLKKNPDENGKKNSKNQKTDTGISIVPQEGSRKGSRRRPNTPDESNNTSCSNTLVIAKSIIPEEIPKPPTATGEQFSPDSVYQDLESYFADTELLQEILEMLTP